MIRNALNIVSPRGTRGRLSILIFHRVLPQPDPLSPAEPDAQHFDQLMRWVKSWFNVIPLDHAAEALRADELPARAAAITFDDGYADNRTIALPILQKHGLTATFFIATGFLDGGRMWNDTVIEAIRATNDPQLDLSALNLGSHLIRTDTEKRAAIANIIQSIKYLAPADRLTCASRIADTLKAELPNTLMMTSEQVREMRAAGMLIGAHTVSHPILARLNIADARREIGESKERLEGILGNTVMLFAYPNGKPGIDYREEHAKLVDNLGFSTAVSTAPGTADSQSDYFQLPRFTPWDKSFIKFGARMLQNYFR